MTIIRRDLVEFCQRTDLSTAALAEVMDALPAIEPFGWIAGGALRRTLLGKPLDSDFDFFFKGKEAMDDWCAMLPLTKGRETEHATNYRGVLLGMEKPIDLQAIHFRYYQTAEEVIDSFDYTITQFALDGAELVTTDDALWDLGRRRLAVHKITYPVASMRRMIKYTAQGFTACSGAMATLLSESALIPEAQANVKYID